MTQSGRSELKESIINKREEDVWTNLGKKLLNACIGRMVDLCGRVDLDGLRHVYILNESRHRIRL